MAFDILNALQSKADTAAADLARAQDELAAAQRARDEAAVTIGSEPVSNVLGHRHPFLVASDRVAIAEAIVAQANTRAKAAALLVEQGRARVPGLQKLVDGCTYDRLAADLEPSVKRAKELFRQSVELRKTIEKIVDAHHARAHEAVRQCEGAGINLPQDATFRTDIWAEIARIREELATICKEQNILPEAALVSVPFGV